MRGAFVKTTGHNYSTHPHMTNYTTINPTAIQTNEVILKYEW